MGLLKRREKELPVPEPPVQSGLINARIGQQEAEDDLPAEPPRLNPVADRRALQIKQRVKYFEDNYRGIFTPAGSGFSADRCFELDLLFGILSEVKLLREDVLRESE